MIIDTTVVSEVMRGDPSGVIGSWLLRGRTDTLSMSAVTVQEITYGLARLPEGRRRTAMTTLWDELRHDLPLAVLPLDGGTAVLAGELMALRERQGHPIGVPDAQIAATCLAHRAALATRNVRDFDGFGIEIDNPWG